MPLESFLIVFSLLVFLYFFCVGNNFFFHKCVFFKSDQADREAMDGGARDLTYAVFELSSDMVPFLRSEMNDSCVRHE